MAELHRTTLGNTLILEVNATPNAAITAPRGSKAYDSATGDEYVNTNGAQAWTKLAKTGDAPTAHAASHIGGAGDAIADAVAAGAAGLMSGADKTKLDGVEALADVTDLTNVSGALGTTAAAAVTDTGTGAGNAGKLLKLDAGGLADGRDLATDGTKLDGVEALADVTDLANVSTALGTTAAAAVTDTGAGAGNAGKILKLDAGGLADGRDLATDGTKLDGVEALADVTDATNVNAAGAVMESDAVTPLNRLTLGATSTLAANVIGAATETIHTALTLTSAMLNTARRWIKWRALLRVVTANGADTWQIRARFGGVGGILLVDSTAKDIAAGDLVEIQGDIFIDTIGAATVAKIQTLTMIAGGGNFAMPITTRVFDETNPSTEISNTLVVTGTCNTADAGNTVSLVAFEAEVMPA